MEGLNIKSIGMINLRLKKAVKKEGSCKDLKHLSEELREDARSLEVLIEGLDKLKNKCLKEELFIDEYLLKLEDLNEE